MNGDFPINLEEVIRYLEHAETFSLYFPLLGKALVVDYRCNEEEGPFIRVLPMVASVEERVKSFRRLRPRFPPPSQLLAIPWPKHIQSLYLWGVWDKISNRLLALGHSSTQQACQLAIRQLLHAEREELSRAIKGEGYHTLWPVKK